MVPGTHGSTFGGNPLAMAVGNAVIDQINNNLGNFEDFRVVINDYFKSNIETYDKLINTLCTNKNKEIHYLKNQVMIPLLLLMKLI